MAIAFKHTGSTIDLTSVATNPLLAPEATPRLGGFVLRNRFSGAKAITLSASQVVGASSAVKNNPIRVLSVPRRTLVQNVNVFAVEGETVPGHAFAYGGTSASLSASDQAGKLLFVAQPYKKGTTLASLSASLNVASMTLTPATASLIKGSLKGAPLKAVNSRVNSSTSSATKGAIKVFKTMTASNVIGASTIMAPKYFPHGGKIVLTLGGTVVDSDTKINNLSGVCSGVWEVQAECEYCPE